MSHGTKPMTTHPKAVETLPLTNQPYGGDKIQGSLNCEDFSSADHEFLNKISCQSVS